MSKAQFSEFNKYVIWIDLILHRYFIFTFDLWHRPTDQIEFSIQR